MTADRFDLGRLRVALRPQHWPVRWRLAVTSAALTMAILVAFAAVVGQLAATRIRNDFNNDLRNAAEELAPSYTVVVSGVAPVVEGPIVLRDQVMPRGSAIRIVNANGIVLDHTAHVPPMGTVRPGLTSVGNFEVATSSIRSDPPAPRTYLQYARSRSSVEATIGRLWLFLAAGVLGGTALATLAGLAVAGRAMRPIASLTATARTIAATGDPSMRIPEPQSDDEVAELARTLEQMLRALDASRGETEHAMQVQREFLADASHELRTPLTSVLANLELLQAALDAGRYPEQRETVDSALRSSKRMSRLVSDLLVLARADAGRHGERRDCDLAGIAADALAEVEPVAGKRSLEIRAADGVPVSANSDELHRLALNLLENAVRHTPDDSSVTVSVFQTDGKAVLEVADDGPGIPENLREQVFGRFVRGAGPADTIGGAGAGLGLAIVRAVAEGHGGNVSAEGAPGGGALLRVELPLGRQTAPDDLVKPPLGAL